MKSKGYESRFWKYMSILNIKRIKHVSSDFSGLLNLELERVT